MPHEVYPHVDDEGNKCPESGVPDEKVAAFFDSVMSSKPVNGLTHNFYRYPARFSPEFARQAIAVFTDPGDLVLDPFMGGCTAAVESLALGRRFAGCDINPLSIFLGNVKTTPLTRYDEGSIARWGVSFRQRTNLHTPDHQRHTDWERYQRNVPWWIRKALEIGIDSTHELDNPRQQNFARCTLLRAAQIALDCRSELPSTERFLSLHESTLSEMLAGIRSFTEHVSRSFATPPCELWKHKRFFCQSAEEIATDRRSSVLAEGVPPKLVLTSPPYIGIHVLYHRWQVQGRRETPAPYWIAACDDGQGEAHYTLAGRRRKDPEVYMSVIRQCFASIAEAVSCDTRVVQLVAFANPAEQLPLYLEAMEKAGFAEEAELVPERLWRSVPGRRWYARHRTGLASNKEVLLIHKKTSSS